jgi:hypothetical protein
VREPYFSGAEIKAAMAVVAEAQRATAGKKVEPRPFKLPGDKKEVKPADPKDIKSPGDEISPEEKSAKKDVAKKKTGEKKAAKEKQIS